MYPSLNCFLGQNPYFRVFPLLICFLIWLISLSSDVKNYSFFDCYLRNYGRYEVKLLLHGNKMIWDQPHSSDFWLGPKWGKNCRKPHCHNGVVDHLGLVMPASKHDNGYWDILLIEIQWKIEAAFSYSAKGRRQKHISAKKYWNVLKLLSICCICSFNLIFANSFLMITFFNPQGPGPYLGSLRNSILLPIRGGVIKD